MKHRTKDGKKISLKDLEDYHLANIIRRHRKLAREGITLRYGGTGVDIDEIWYDEEMIIGQDVLDYFKHHKYLEEATRRGLKV